MVRAVRFVGLSLALLMSGIGSVSAAGAAEFTLTDMHGREHRLSDYRGKWVLVNYWATWCPPCLEELPELEVFHSNAEGTAVVLGVNMEDIELESLRAFVDGQFLSFPILVAGASPNVGQRVGPVNALPTSYLISPAGEVVARQEGTVTAEGIRKFIQAYEARDAG